MTTAKLEIGMNYDDGSADWAGREVRNSVLEEGTVTKASYLKCKTSIKEAEKKLNS
jgi:hypothetical protein